MCRLMVSIHYPHEILAVESIQTSLFGYLSLQLIGKSLADLQGSESNFDILHRAINSTYHQQNENLIHTTLYGLDGTRSSLNVSCMPCAPNGWDRCFISLYPNSVNANHHRLDSRSDTSSDKSSTVDAIGAPKNQRRRGARPVQTPLIVDDSYMRRLRRRLRADQRRKAAATADIVAAPPPATRSASPGTDPGAGAAQTPQRKPCAPLGEQAPRRPPAADLPGPAALDGDACCRSLGREPWEGGGPLSNPSSASDESHGGWPAAAAEEEELALPRLQGDADWLGWADGPADLRGGAPGPQPGGALPPYPPAGELWALPEAGTGWPDSVWARAGGEGPP